MYILLGLDAELLIEPLISFHTHPLACKHVDAPHPLSLSLPRQIESGPKDKGMQAQGEVGGGPHQTKGFREPHLIIYSDEWRE